MEGMLLFTKTDAKWLKQLNPNRLVSAVDTYTELVFTGGKRGKQIQWSRSSFKLQRTEICNSLHSGNTSVSYPM